MSNSHVPNDHDASIRLTLPSWLTTAENALWPAASTDETAQARFVIELSRRNVEAGTGGPFGAAVFEIESGRLVAAGVNVVVPSHCSLAHGEMMALSRAQALLGTHDLGAPGLPNHVLVSSAEPCAMCAGAVCWSGVRRLVYCAEDRDVRQAGFDEGPKHPAWEKELERRGISVLGGICREEAAEVLEQYRRSGHAIYNARQG